MQKNAIRFRHAMPVQLAAAFCAMLPKPLTWRPAGLINQTLLVMRLTIVLILLSVFSVQAKVTAQHVTISGKDLTLKQVFAAIEQQTGYVLLSQKEALADARPVSLSVTGYPLEKMLDMVFRDQQLEYVIKGKTIVVTRKATVRPFSEILFDAPPFRICVTDSVGNPLPGASVAVKNRKASGITDARGETALDVREGDVLLVSFVGYETRTVPVTRSLMENGTFTVALLPSVTRLGEVDVMFSTGYQVIPKERATGSFTQVDNKLFNRQLGTNFLDRIVDVTSGLSFEPRLSNYGNSSQLNIRGISTINSNMKPLIIVDDFPYDGDLGNINPNDISSITVLKDAAAASIWGVRAGNGVIVVITKKGASGRKPSIQLNSNVTFGEKPRIFSQPMLSSADIIGFQKNLFASGFYNSFDDDAPLQGSFPTLPEVAEILLAQRRGELTEQEAAARLNALAGQDVRYDIDRYLNRTSVNQQHSLSVSGGMSNYQYYASIGYDNNKSNMKGDDYDRITVRFDNTFKPFRNFEISGFISYVESTLHSNSVYIGLPDGSGRIAPYTKIKDESGHLAIPWNIRQAFIDTARYPNLLDWNYRPLDELDNMDNSTRQTDARMGLNLKYTIVKGLNAEFKYQYQKANTDYRKLSNLASYAARDMINRYMSGDPVTTVYGIPLGGILETRNGSLNAWNVRAQLNYNGKWQQHEVMALGGTEVRESNNDYSGHTNYGYDAQTNQTIPVNYAIYYPYFSGYGFGQALVPYRDEISGNISRYRSYFANAGYTYDGRYTITGSARMDGSNFYGIKANQRKVPLWSAGFAWTASNETFYRAQWLPYLKIRASYGYNGNTNNSAAAYSLISYENNFYTQAPVAYLTSPPNPALRWEKIRMVNLAVDFSGKDDRISGTAELYFKRGIDLISAISVDPTSGVTQFTGNNASIKGGGIDITLNTVNIRTAFFSWTTNLLFSAVRDKVTAYSIKPTSRYDYLQSTALPVLGNPLFSLYAFKWAGLSPEDGTPRVYVADTVTSYNIASSNAAPEDLLYVGPSLPRMFGSFRNTFAYRSFSLSVNITYRLGYYFRKNSISYYNLYNNWGGHSDYNMRWQKPGDELRTNVPSLPDEVNSFSVDDVYANSSVMVEKADHIRLQDVRLGYDLSGERFAKGRISAMQVFVYGSNLGLLWKANRSDIDPVYQGPKPPRSVAVGLTLGF